MLSCLNQTPLQVFSGPGLPDKDWDVKLTGPVISGGQTPNNMMERCLELLGDVGEEEVYALYRAQPASVAPYRRN